MRMLTGAVALSIALSSGQVLVLAQIASPNRSGVAMGHLHYLVRDIDLTKRFWTTLGGTPLKVGDTEAVKFPDALVLLSRGEPSDGTEGSVVNHVAFRVQSFAALEAAGIKVQRIAQFPGVGSATTPEGERIELFEESAGNMWFMPDSGQEDPVVQRHNRKLTVPIAAYHVHLYLPESAVAEAKNWYVRTFGAVPGKRWRYDAADLPGVNLNFSASPRPVAPTRGRRLDHIGFEVENLESFCRKLEAQGVKLDALYSKGPAGVATARLTDPWGTSIELTEGLRGF
jgi:catechol 2,3-dioxygenase-like lactoylglutathione lyase family enzyme